MRLDISSDVKRSQSGGFHLDIDLDNIIPEALDYASHFLVETTKDAIDSVVSHDDRSTGELIASVTAGKAKKVKGGGYYVAIKFPGTGSNGTRNGLKAAELEYGNTRGQDPAPFADRAAYFAESEIAEAVGRYIEEAIDE